LKFLREENGRYITFKSEKNIWTSREKLKEIGIESETRRSPEKCFVPPAGRKKLPARHGDGLPSGYVKIAIENDHL
jgi:hypothetical protein